MSHAHHALVALILITAFAGHAGQINADTISDAKKLKYEGARCHERDTGRNSWQRGHRP